MIEQHLCPERGSLPPHAKLTPHDTWRVMPDGTQTCSFCGSMREEDFLCIAEAYTNGEEGYHFERSDKGYKFYANKPGVKNALEGAIKFYTWHVDRDPVKLAQAEEKVTKAHRLSVERFKARWGARPCT